MIHLIITPIQTPIFIPIHSGDGCGISIMISVQIALFITGVFIVLESMIRCHIINKHRYSKLFFHNEFDGIVGLVFMAVSALFIVVTFMSVLISNLIR